MKLSKKGKHLQIEFEDEESDNIENIFDDRYSCDVCPINMLEACDEICETKKSLIDYIANNIISEEG